MSKEIIDKLQASVKSSDVDFSAWYERLKFFREKVLELSQSQLAKKIGLDLTAVSRYERGAGAKNITYNIKQRLKEAFGEEITQWIATGELPKEQPKHTDIAQIKSSQPSTDSIPVEVLSVRPSAGGGSHLEAIDIFNSGQRIYIDKALFKTPPKGRVRAMQVDGYSMVPMLFPDSWVLVDETKEFVGDGLYVINSDNVLMVKLLEKNLETGNLWVKSVNPQYDSWEIKESDQRPFEIYGKVLRCII